MKGGFRTRQLSRAAEVIPVKGAFRIRSLKRERMPAKREQAIVKPPAGGKMRFKQSRFEHMASIPS